MTNEKLYFYKYLITQLWPTTFVTLLFPTTMNLKMNGLTNWHNFFTWISWSQIRKNRWKGWDWKAFKKIGFDTISYETWIVFHKMSCPYYKTLTHIPMFMVVSLKCSRECRCLHLSPDLDIRLLKESRNPVFEKLTQQNFPQIILLWVWGRSGAKLSNTDFKETVKH